MIGSDSAMIGHLHAGGTRQGKRCHAAEVSLPQDVKLHPRQQVPRDENETENKHRHSITQ